MIMKTSKQNFAFSQKVLVLALLAAINPVHAGDEEVAALSKPDSAVVSVGLGAIAGDQADRAVFGQYNGWRNNAGNLLLDYSRVSRDDATGLWTNVDVRNLGLDNRELSFSQQKQGDWKYTGEYSQLVRHEPRTVNGFGGGSFEIKRQGFSLSAEKWISKSLSVEASYKSEKKDGQRLSGVGNYCSNIISGYACASTVGALILMAEPLDSSTHQFEAKVNYAGSFFLISGGYYGSFYKNSASPMNTGALPLISGDAKGELGKLLANTVATAPDNEAHQFYVMGNAKLNDFTRANFNVAYTHATQNDDFAGAGLTPNFAGAPANLGGEMNRTFAQVGVTSRPLKNLSLLADWRFEDLADETPIYAYSGMYSNTPASSKKDNAKLEATYRLPENFSVTAGFDYAYVKRARPLSTTLIPDGSMTALREQTEESTGRIELRRNMSETLNASLGYLHGEREGYHWYSLVPGSYPYVRYDSFAKVGNTAGTFPVTMMDRKRDKVRLMVDWSASDALSLQFVLEDGKDNYDAPSTAGVKDTGMKTIGVDAALTLSDKWTLTGYLNKSEQTLHVAQSTGYDAALVNRTTSVGVGAKGKLDSKTELGGNLSYLSDINRYAMASSLPDVKYSAVSLKLYGKYAMNDRADVLVDLTHQRVQFNEWSWAYAGVPFAYAGGSTTVSMQPDQNVTFIGARYVYKLK